MLYLVVSMKMNFVIPSDEEILSDTGCVLTIDENLPDVDSLFDEEDLPFSITDNLPLSEQVIVSLIDKKTNQIVTLAVPLAPLWQFSMFFNKRELHLENISPEAFEAFVEFIINKDEPQSLVENFGNKESSWVVEDLVRFMTNNLTHREQNRQKVSAFIAFATAVKNMNNSPVFWLIPDR